MWTKIFEEKVNYLLLNYVEETQKTGTNQINTIRKYNIEKGWSPCLRATRARSTGSC